MTTLRKAAAGIAAAGAAVAALSGCGINGSQTLPTPFVAGSGSGSYRVTVDMADVANLVPHSEVKVADVTVGTVESLKFDNWHAKVEIRLEKNVDLPADTVATVAQKSLLGAEYLDLSAPTSGAAATKGDPTSRTQAASVTSPTVTDTGPRLHNGSVIPLAHTGNYPETEEVLAALATVLNGSGLSQIKTITVELNQALTGRQQDARALLTNLDSLAGGLDKQKSDIVATIDNVDALGAALAKGNQTIATALDKVAPGLAALNANRINLADTLTALSTLGDTATQLISATQGDISANLRDLQPALKNLVTVKDQLVDTIGLVATYPFPLDNTTRNFRGDYSNLFAAVDLRCSTLTTNFLSGLPVADASKICALLANTSPNTTTNPLSTLLGGGVLSGGASGVTGTLGGVLGNLPVVGPLLGNVPSTLGTLVPPSTLNKLVGGLPGGGTSSSTPSTGGSSGSSKPGGGLLNGLVGGGG